jgi:hypothetical protein
MMQGSEMIPIRKSNVVAARYSSVYATMQIEWYWLAWVTMGLLSHWKQAAQ